MNYVWIDHLYVYSFSVHLLLDYHLNCQLINIWWEEKRNIHLIGQNFIRVLSAYINHRGVNVTEKYQKNFNLHNE